MGAERGILNAARLRTGSLEMRTAGGATRITGEGGLVAQAYCVKGKHMVEIANAQKVTMKNGKPAIKGTCPVHGTTVYRIGAS